MLALQRLLRKSNHRIRHVFTSDRFRLGITNCQIFCWRECCLMCHSLNRIICQARKSITFNRKAHGDWISTYLLMVIMGKWGQKHIRMFLRRNFPGCQILRSVRAKLPSACQKMRRYTSCLMWSYLYLFPFVQLILQQPHRLSSTITKLGSCHFIQHKSWAEQADLVMLSWCLVPGSLMSTRLDFHVDLIAWLGIILVRKIPRTAAWQPPGGLESCLCLISLQVLRTSPLNVAMEGSPGWCQFCACCCIGCLVDLIVVL